MACSTCSHGQQVLLVDPDWLLMVKLEFPSAVATEEFVVDPGNPSQGHPAVGTEFVDGVPLQSHVLNPAVVAESCRQLAPAQNCFVVDETGGRVGAQ